MKRWFTALPLAFSGSLFAGVCTVPGGYPDIQAAVDDTDCSIVQFGPGNFEGSVAVTRTLDLVGTGAGSTTLFGVLTVSGPSTLVNAQGFSVNGGCEGSRIEASNGGSLIGENLFSVLVPAGEQCSEVPIFSDGFESTP